MYSWHCGGPYSGQERVLGKHIKRDWPKAQVILPLAIALNSRPETVAREQLLSELLHYEASRALHYPLLSLRLSDHFSKTYQCKFPGWD